MDQRREDRTGCDGAEAPGNQPLQRATQRVARQTLHTFGEMVDAKQEQAQSTQELYGRGGIH